MFEKSSENEKRKLIVSGVKSAKTVKIPIQECISTLSPTVSIKKLSVLRFLNVLFKENRFSRDWSRVNVREISIKGRHRRNQRKQGKRKENRTKPQHVSQSRFHQPTRHRRRRGSRQSSGGQRRSASTTTTTKTRSNRASIGRTSIGRTTERKGTSQDRWISTSGWSRASRSTLVRKRMSVGASLGRKETLRSMMSRKGTSLGSLKRLFKRKLNRSINLVICFEKYFNLNNLNATFNVLLIPLSELNLSVESIAKATLCLSRPSIITSKTCHLSTPLPLSHSSLTFTKKESGLCPDIQLLPVTGIKLSLLIISRNLTSFRLTYEFSIMLFKINEKPEKILKYIESFALLVFVVASLLIYTKDKSFKVTRTLLLLLKCAGDIESNPGPDGLLLVSQNCRGLKNKEKFKQLLCRLQSGSQTTKIVALQETHLDSTYIKYSWLGNIALTPSTGSKGGVITLTSGNISIQEQHDIDDEGHVLLLEIIGDKDSQTLVVANLHSPCAHNEDKVQFFSKIKDKILDLMQRHDGCNIIVLGDFNTTFSPLERINTLRNKNEINVAKKITDLFSDLELKDCWNNHENTMTWRHGEKMSRIDRIQWSESLALKHTSTKTDWTLTSSDHAAVIVQLNTETRNPHRTVITRIDTSFLSNIILRTNFIKEIDARMDQLKETKLDPHGRLEFLKVSIRSVAIEIATNYKKKMIKEFNEIQQDISFWQKAFENSSNAMFRDLAITNLDRLTAKRDDYLANRGKYLSERSKSKWYQEGERSTKYFLNLNRTKNNKNEMSDLIIDGVITKDMDQISSHVNNFYKNLYEKGDKNYENNSLIGKFIGNLAAVPEEHIKQLDTKITADELLTTLKSCQDSAPGPDGIPYSLIKLTWKHFGKILVESWNYTQESGRLPPSHESSYLRLLPKAGKDISLLKNWRPITLSNCDFKIITKTLSWRLAKAVESVISPNQTAYLKNRQISDNLNVMLYTLEQNDNVNGMVVSLDAEKAFDSIEHWYIKKILNKIGLSNFNKIFEILYKNQEVDIILNGNNSGKYKIKNGVKQGDALSCILFILGIEPLLQNINNDTSIEPVNGTHSRIPKAVAYADDIACIINPDPISLQTIFRHYNDLTKVSGLRLNADKTEIISRGGPRSYDITYNSKSFRIVSQHQMKVNGVILSYDTESARKINIMNMIELVRNQLNSWSNRNLSLIGKIQIFKTFGLSQILYTLSVVQIMKNEEKILTEVIYKFIWNRNMEANKAPDRIKRSILLNKVKNLGFGMIDYKEVVKGIRIKNTLRLLNTDCSPLANIIKSSINNSLICIDVTNPIREPIDSSIKLVRQLWNNAIMNEDFVNNSELMEIICREYIGYLLVPKYKKRKLAKAHRNDSINEILMISLSHPVLKLIRPKVAAYLNTCNFIPTTSMVSFDSIPYKKKIIKWPKITSKIIRNAGIIDEVTTPKMLNNYCADDLKKLGSSIATLTNSKLKTTLLRCLHGDVYSKERLNRFGMSDDNLCSRCAEVESTSHMLFECDYVNKLWIEASHITGILPLSINYVLGLNERHDKVTLTIHSEILRRLLAIDRPTIDPKKFLKSVIVNLNILEKGVTKYQIGKYLEIMD